MDEKLKWITNNIKYCRIKAGYTQDKASQELGMSRVHYNQCETNPAKVKVELFDRMSTVFGCDISDFFKKEDVTLSDLKNLIETKQT